MPTDFDAYNNGDVVLNNLLVLFIAIAFILWFLQTCVTTIRIQELRNSLRNRAIIWLPGLSSYAYYVPMLSTEHLEKLLSTRKDMPSVPVPKVQIGFSLKSCSIHKDSDNKYHVKCEILSTRSLQYSVNSFWLVPIDKLQPVQTNACVASSSNSNSNPAVRCGEQERDTNSFDPLKKLFKETPLKRTLRRVQSASSILGSQAVPEGTETTHEQLENLEVNDDVEKKKSRRSSGRISSFGFSLPHRSIHENHVDTPVSELRESEYQAMVPEFVTRQNASLEHYLSSNFVGIEPLVIVISAEENKSAPNVAESTVYVVNLDSSLKGRIARQMCVLGNKEVVEMLEMFGFGDECDCVICLSDLAEVMLLPCRHVCVCANCFKDLDKCPVCRADFETFIKFIQDETSSFIEENNGDNVSSRGGNRRFRLRFWKSIKKKK